LIWRLFGSGSIAAPTEWAVAIAFLTYKIMERMNPYRGEPITGFREVFFDEMASLILLARAFPLIGRIER